jgi:hypothetical protein
MAIAHIWGMHDYGFYGNSGNPSTNSNAIRGFYEILSRHALLSF